MEKVVVFGAGLSGLGAKELLESKSYKVYLVDDKVGISSENGIKILSTEDVKFIVKSPGIPWGVDFLLEAKKKNIEIISEIDLAYKYMDKDTKIISITGTNGKTTTATKIFELLEYAGYKVALAGNAGYSFAKLVLENKKLDYIVLELSSYQLENNPKVHSDIAGIINLTPDHLTRYDSLYDYYITKFNVFKNQTNKDFSIINLDDVEILKIIEKVKNCIASNNILISKELKGSVFVYNNNVFTLKNLNENVEEFLRNTNNDTEKEKKINEKAEFIIAKKDISLKGNHNLENVLFIIAVGKLLNIPVEIINKFLKETKPLEHRLENFYVKGNTIFINDSKGTNKESTIKAIDSFENAVTLICGGEDKKMSQEELIDHIVNKVDFVYLIGETAPLLEKQLLEKKYNKCLNLEKIENVIKHIKGNVNFNEDRTILFSPGTSSFDQFKNFEERGKIFKDLTIEILGEK